MSTNVVAILAIAVLQAIPAAVKSQKAQLTDVDNGCGVETYLTALDTELARRQEALNSGTNPLSKQRQTYAIAAAAEQDQENACLLAAIAAAAAAAAEGHQTKLRQALAALQVSRQAVARDLRDAAVAAALEQITFKVPDTPAYQHDGTTVSLRLQARQSKPQTATKRTLTNSIN
ncbi:hypothetical protein DPX39_060060900 [Trypanosoma brucei equiperdum]|uniref:Trypanosomal VSG domain containing protein n=1 Tax=Trypanosoma brucei equiperdum TaxID=630700 RepID=A0A3L6L5H7_9TRYP|nr:hypothetical protein DPX39_060060900 [Trypanosoma brucei equiperdum]